MNVSKWCLVVGLISVGCAPKNPGKHPHDMSAADHDAEALRQEAAAGEHDAQYDPAAVVTAVDCARLGGLTTVHYSGPCWTVVVNPTQQHLDAADLQRRMAAEHRAASAELREVEATACAGISDDDRDVSPFEHLQDISSIEPLTATRTDGKNRFTEAVGVTVTFRAVPGLTGEYLQRIMDCHLARNAVLGHVAPEMPNCPLVPNGAEARVSSTGVGFAVAIRANDADAGADILARAQRLALNPPAEAP